MFIQKILSISTLYLFTIALNAQTVSDSIINQGVKRTFHLNIPSTYNGIGELPLVVVFHGGNLNGKTFMGNSYFDEIGDTTSFFTVFPDAYKGNWTDGRGNTAADSEGIDDLIFFLQ